MMTMTLKQIKRCRTSTSRSHCTPISWSSGKMHGLLLRKKGGGLEFSDDWRNANENDWPASCIEHWAQCPVSSNHQEKQKPAHVWYFDGEDNGEDGGNGDGHFQEHEIDSQQVQNFFQEFQIIKISQECDSRRSGAFCDQPICS